MHMYPGLEGLDDRDLEPKPREKSRPRWELGQRQVVKIINEKGNIPDTKIYKEL